MNTSVLVVEPVSKSDAQFSQWRVTTLNLVTRTEETTIFDAIMICNGYTLFLNTNLMQHFCLLYTYSHHSEPDIPELPVKDNFWGEIMHSHAYREAKPFKGQRVLVVGAGPSALDIALEVSKEAERVITFST